MPSGSVPGGGSTSGPASSCSVAEGGALGLLLRYSSSDKQMNRERSWPHNFGLIFLKMNSSSDLVNAVGKLLTASMKLYTLRRVSEAEAGGVILSRGLGS